MILRLTVTGVTDAKIRFTHMAERVADVSPVAPLIVNVLRTAARKTFDMMGERGDPPAWEPDSFAWLSRKVREGLDPRTERATGALYNSLSTAGTTRVNKSGVAFGTRIRYARYQTRQLIKLTAEDRNEIRQIWFDYIVTR